MRKNNYCWMNDMDFLKTLKEKDVVEIVGCLKEPCNPALVWN
jgi:hypothetical protein